MKKSILFIVGGVIILILVAIWGYLFFFGTPQSSDEFFADLGLSGEVDTSYVPPPETATTTAPVVNMERPKLRQLTTKPIAGYAEVIHSTSTPPLLYYVEKGTGHVYTIDTQSGEETRVSQTTIAQAEHAVISSDGAFAAITSFSNNKNKPLYVGAFGTTTLTTDSMNLTEVFAGAAQDVTITNEEVLYTTVGAAGLVGTAYDLIDDTTSTLFTFPLTDAKIMWGSAADAPHYLYPKASYALEGFLYEINGNKLTRLPVSGFGLTAKTNEDMVLFTRGENGSTKSYLYNRVEQVTKALDAVVLPEKCIMPENGLEFICPFESTRLPYEFPDVWYQGTLGFKDSLWLLNGETMSGEMLVDTFAESSREIDIIGMKISTARAVLYFINKNDNTLWMYEI